MGQLRVTAAGPPPRLPLADGPAVDIAADSQGSTTIPSFRAYGFKAFKSCSYAAARDCHGVAALVPVTQSQRRPSLVTARSLSVGYGPQQSKGKIFKLSLGILNIPSQSFKFSVPPRDGHWQRRPAVTAGTPSHGPQSRSGWTRTRKPQPQAQAQPPASQLSHGRAGPGRAGPARGRPPGLPAPP